MGLKRQVTLTFAVTSYIYISFYLLVIGFSTNYWSVDGKFHEGLWKNCSNNDNFTIRKGNETYILKVTCCSSYSDGKVIRLLS